MINKMKKMGYAILDKDISEKDRLSQTYETEVLAKANWIHNNFASVDNTWTKEKVRDYFENIKKLKKDIKLVKVWYEIVE